MQSLGIKRVPFCACASAQSGFQITFGNNLQALFFSLQERNQVCKWCAGHRAVSRGQKRRTCRVYTKSPCVFSSEIVCEGFCVLSSTWILTFTSSYSEIDLNSQIDGVWHSGCFELAQIFDDTHPTIVLRLTSSKYVYCRYKFKVLVYDFSNTTTFIEWHEPKEQSRYKHKLYSRLAFASPNSKTFFKFKSHKKMNHTFLSWSKLHTCSPFQGEKNMCASVIQRYRWSTGRSRMTGRRQRKRLELRLE